MGSECYEALKETYECMKIDHQNTCLTMKIKEVDAVIDFTKAEGAFINAVISLTNHVPILIGTTGLSKEQKACLKKIADHSQTGCILVNNFSYGMNWIKKQIKDLDVFFSNTAILETHQHEKKDFPSGTALELAAILHVAKDQIQSYRTEEQFAKHELQFNSEDEQLIITHIVKNRKAYMPLVKDYLARLDQIHEYIEL